MCFTCGKHRIQREHMLELVCLGKMEQGQLPGACEFPGGTNRSGAPSFEGRLCMTCGVQEPRETETDERRFQAGILESVYTVSFSFAVPFLKITVFGEAVTCFHHSIAQGAAGEQNEEKQLRKGKLMLWRLSSRFEFSQTAAVSLPLAQETEQKHWDPGDVKGGPAGSTSNTSPWFCFLTSRQDNLD
ncbi:hypothetical protein DUI87_29324 [Hirundo rustica rustica]|uniref:Uncharacterized protein n=1 Tax=Hirundo rustica rustica TaxID=333673 RepID=A0A3M0J6K6_HIRRU|nr:hypothetical protein DUI87_29324 [Hirundo rustica rustica]